MVHAPYISAAVPTRAYRSVFVSDLHLGARACRPGPVIAFLRSVEAEYLYLVGDILDTFHGGQVHWGPAQEAVVGELERLARIGTRVVYLPGNHDAPLRAPDAAPPFAGTELREALIHIGADGRRHLVLHGDQCDRRLMRWHVMTRLGSRADAAVRRLDANLTRRFGVRRGGRSPLEAVLAVSNRVMNLGEGFERRLTALAAAAGAEGVICGHSHRPALKRVGEIAYANCGDWVDSFTALAEQHDRVFRLLRLAPEAVTSAPGRGPVAGPIGGPIGGLEPARLTTERRA